MSLIQEDLTRIFDEHLADIALDVVREPRQAYGFGAVTPNLATGWLNFLAKSQAELIDLTTPINEIAEPVSELVSN